MTASATAPDVIRLRPVGPQAARFLASTAFASFIMGPVGSGKTIACAQHLLHFGASQTPRRDANGVLIRHAKAIVVGSTYPVIDANLLPSWFRVVPEDKGFSWDAPRTHRFQRGLRRDRETGRITEILDMVVEFRAIGDKSVEDALRGSECSIAWLYEADTLSQAVFSFMSGRVGRYVPFDGFPVVNPQIIGDFNAPDIDNWTYTTFVDRQLDEALVAALEATLDGQKLMEFFPQPPAIDKDGIVNPNAENLANLPKGYYERQYALNRHRKNYIDRMLRNKFAPAQHGQPVYGDEFDMERHVAAGPLAADPRRQLVVGLDAGLTPAAVIGQRSSTGKLRVLGELAVFAETDQMLTKLGPKAFAEELRRFLLEHYPDHYRPADRGLAARAANSFRHNGGPPLDEDEDDLIAFTCDPAARDGTDRTGNEQSWLEIVQREIGYRVRPARTNGLHVRLEAVRLALTTKDGFEMAPSCRILRKGFLSGYHYNRVAVGDGTGRFNSEPNKNQFSHSHDALQYLAMHDEATIAAVMGKAARRGRDRQRGRVDYGTGYFSGGQ